MAKCIRFWIVWSIWFAFGLEQELIISNELLLLLFGFYIYNKYATKNIFNILMENFNACVRCLFCAAKFQCLKSSEPIA